MKSTISLIATIVFIVYLFKRDSRDEYKPSFALWIPSVWLLLLGSRPLSYWIDFGLTSQDVFQSQTTDVFIEGSPTDRAGFFILMTAGLGVLLLRRISWHEVFRNNIAITLFFLYCGISVMWSDFPEVSFKRWCKALGDPIMILIILTDSQPIMAVRTVLRRCVYILIPLSVLFIREFSYLGREYSENEGLVYYTGVAMNKNVLGFVCMGCGFFCVWQLCVEWGKHGTYKKSNVFVLGFLLSMIGWLFYMSDSKTSLLCLIIGSLAIVGLGIQNVRKNVASYLVVCLFLFVLLQLAFNIGELIITGAGRDITLTGRTELWEVVVRMAEHPFIGEGYESFWLGERLKKLWALYYFKPVQAHSGYIEMYLNLGSIGLLFLGGVIVSYYRKQRRMLLSDMAMTEQINLARFGMGFLIAYLFYNITEAAFKELQFLFVLFLLFAMKYPQLRPQVIASKSIE